MVVKTNNVFRLRLNFTNIFFNIHMTEGNATLYENSLDVWSSTKFEVEKKSKMDTRAIM